MSTEVISFACPNCDRKLKVKVALAGKQAKCPGCSKPLRVPVPKAVGSGAKAKSPSAPKAAPQQEDEFGLGALESDGEELFNQAAAMPKHSKHNPLANHVVENPGFAATDHIAIQGNPDVADEGFARNPLIVQMEQQQQAAAAQQETLAGLKGDAKSNNPLKSPGVVLGLVFGIGLFAAAIFGFGMSASVGMIVSGILGGASSFISLGLIVWGVMLVAKNSAPSPGLHIVLFIFIPFYNIIYSIKNWAAMKSWFGAFCVTVIGSNASWGLFMVFVISEAAKNV